MTRGALSSTAFLWRGPERCPGAQSRLSRRHPSERGRRASIRGADRPGPLGRQHDVDQGTRFCRALPRRLAKIHGNGRPHRAGRQAMVASTRRSLLPLARPGPEAGGRPAARLTLVEQLPGDISRLLHQWSDFHRALVVVNRHGVRPPPVYPATRNYPSRRIILESG